MQLKFVKKIQLLPSISVYERSSPDEDDLGVATPDLVIRYDTHDTESSAQASVMHLLQPLSRENLEEKLKLE
jgi:hypothetical protein